MILLDTFYKRIGALLFIFSLILLFVLAVFWNISEKPFLYKKDYNQFISWKKLENNRDILWIDTDVNHILYQVEKSCYNAYWDDATVISSSRVTEEDLQKQGTTLRKLTGEDIEKLYSKCITGKLISSTRWESSFGEFLVNHGWLLCVILASLLFMFGLLDNIHRFLLSTFVWLRTGKFPVHKEHTVKKKKSKSKSMSLTKKILYASLLIILWTILFTLLKLAGITLGFMPSAILFLALLYVIQKVTGFNLGLRFKNKNL